MVSSWDAHVRLYDASSGMLTALHKHSHAVLDCTFLQDQSRVALAGLTKKVLLWDFQAQQEILLGQHEEAVRCVEFHPFSQQVFSGSWDRSVRSWDPRQGSEPTAALNMGVKTFALDVCDTKLVVAGSDRCIHIFDIRKFGDASGALIEKRESSLKREIRAVKIGADQRSYASSSVEGRVAIDYFDADDNQRLRYAFKCHRVKQDDGNETVHPVNALAYHPVHGTFATGGSDGGVCVWDGLAKKRLWRLNPFDTAVSSLCFSADGTKLAIGVSYTFDTGEKTPPPPTELAIRQITDSEVLPKSKK